MQLTQFSDIGLRVLLYLSHSRREAPATVSEIASAFEVSRNHLVKVVHFMSQQGWLNTSRGKGGGLALAQPLNTYKLGDIIQTLEQMSELVDCQAYPCRLRGQCRLKSILDEAMAAMIAVLNRYTLADAVAEPTASVVILLNQLGMQSKSLGK